jgi:hypothetical protein
MKDYGQILEEIAQTESRIKSLMAKIRECSDISAHDATVHIFATILYEERIKLKTLNWVINQ